MTYLTGVQTIVQLYDCTLYTNGVPHREGCVRVKVDIDGEGTVDYNEFAEVLKAPDMQVAEHTS
jgi:hypothetical protein